jgi:hypothetical protein
MLHGETSQKAVSRLHTRCCEKLTSQSLYSLSNWHNYSRSVRQHELGTTYLLKEVSHTLLGLLFTNQTEDQSGGVGRSRKSVAQLVHKAKVLCTRYNSADFAVGLALTDSELYMNSACPRPSYTQHRKMLGVSSRQQTPLSRQKATAFLGHSAV